MSTLFKTVKRGVVTAVDKAEKSIFESYNDTAPRGQRSSPENTLPLALTSHLRKHESQVEPKTGLLDMRNNSNVQVTVIGSSAQPADASLAPCSGNPTGIGSVGKFILEGNNNAQFCLTAGNRSTANSAASDEETIIRGNTKTQVYSASGLNTDSSTAGNQASSNIHQNKDSQVMSVCSSSNAGAAGDHISGNVGSQIMKVGSSRSHSASNINDNKDSQVMCVSSLSVAEADCERPSQMWRSFEDRPRYTLNSKLDCWDVTLTEKRNLVVAVSTSGMIEFSLTGDRLCSWSPSPFSETYPEEVVAIASLSDGRIAVGLRYSKLVVLLKKLVGHQDGCYAWMEDLRISGLQSVPWRLSTYANDLLAAAEGRFDNVESTWKQGNCVELLCLRNGTLLRSLYFAYCVYSLALTSSALATVSYGKVDLPSGKRSQVIEAIGL